MGRGNPQLLLIPPKRRAATMCAAISGLKGDIPMNKCTGYRSFRQSCRCRNAGDVLCNTRLPKTAARLPGAKVALLDLNGKPRAELRGWITAEGRRCRAYKCNDAGQAVCYEVADAVEKTLANAIFW